MKQYLYTLLFGALCLFLNAGFTSKTSLSGKVTDKTTGLTLPGVSIYIPDLKTGGVTTSEGTYKIENLPTSKVLVQVSLIGYQTIVETVDLSLLTTKDFVLELAVKEMHEVVVTGTSHAGEKNHTPTPVTVVSKTELLQSASANVIDAIAKQPGISQVTTGTSISKPVIRGLGYNRVVVVNDGIRQEGQQWGDEHGIEIDEFGVNKVEILKGPATLSYGSDAMAGVINMISAPTLPQGTINGNILGNYQTNNGQYAYSANVSGNIKGFIWDVRYSAKQAHAYKNSFDNYVYGSGFKENTISGIVGLNKHWGYSHLHFSAYHLQPGIVEGSRDSVSGKFFKKFARNDSTVVDTIVSDTELRSYTIGIPYQDICHYKAVLNNNFYLGNGNLKTTLGFQQNQRKEFGEVQNPDDYGLFFLLNSINYDARYVFAEKNKWQSSLGVNGMYQQSQNKGEEFLVPAYTLFDIGGFVTVKKSYDKFDISGGLRYDIRKMDSDQLLLDTLGRPTTASDPKYFIKFNGFSTSFSNVSGSLGATYQFSDHVFTKINISRGFRAPNIAELGANGEHEGSGRYEMGDAKLKPETSLQFDLALGINTEHVSAEFDLFYNSISHFIYTRKLNSSSGGDSIVDTTNPIPTFLFSQGNADLFGGEALVDIHPHPLDWLHFENAFSFVIATQQNATDSTRYLPFIPGPKFSSLLRADLKKTGKALKNLYVKAGVEYYFEQDRSYSAFGTETTTPAYLLVNLGMGTDFLSKEKTVCSLFVSVNNLGDVTYQDHLSRLKYADVNYASGRRGVYNMGRNVSVKLVVPFGLKRI